MNAFNNAPIGIFDSGVGGLTVVREVMRQMPRERIVYFGDTARVPYGSKSQSTIIRYSRQDIAFLQSCGVKAIVVACNTASAMALPHIQQDYELPILGVVERGARLAAQRTRNGRVGIIGTRATVQSGLHRRIIEEIDPAIVTVSKACPLFVPLVEECLFHDVVTEEIARRYLQVMKDDDVDTLILGCTHYPFLRSTIRRVMGEGVDLINPAYETALELRGMLESQGLTCGQDVDAAGEKYQFFVSDGADAFRQFAASALEMDIPSAAEINIEDY